MQQNMQNIADKDNALIITWKLLKTTSNKGQQPAMRRSILLLFPTINVRVTKIKLSIL